MPKPSQNQIALLQALQANPEEKIQTYYPVRSNVKKCYLTKRHINFYWSTVEALYKQGYLEMHQSTGYPKEESYTLSEKGKNYNATK